MQNSTNEPQSYHISQSSTAPSAGAAMVEDHHIHQQQQRCAEGSNAQPAPNAASYGPAMTDQHGASHHQHQQDQHRPIVTTTNRHVSDYSDSYDWEGTAATGGNISSQRLTSHPNSPTDSFYQPLSFGAQQRQQTSSASPFGSFSEQSQANYVTQHPATGVSSTSAVLHNVYDAQAANANTHNVFAQSGISIPSVLASASNPTPHDKYMAIDTPMSSRLEQESEGYLSPSSSEPTAPTPDPSQYISPSQTSRGGMHPSLSTFGRSASPSPSVSYTPTSYQQQPYNTSQAFSPGAKGYRSAGHYSSSGGLSDSSMDDYSSSLALTSTHSSLLKQELHRNGKPKRPLNSFMIFARQRRPDLQKVNPNMKVADIAKELSKEWKDMPAEKKKEYFEAAKIVKESFHKMHPDYVYSRRPNGSRKSGSGGAGGSNSGHRRRASSATPSSSGSTTGGGTAADIGESAPTPPPFLSASTPPSMANHNHHTTPNNHRGGKTRSRPLAGSKGAGGSYSGVRSSDSEKSAFSPGYESNTSDAEIGNTHMPMPMPPQLSQSFSFPPNNTTAREGDAGEAFRSLAASYDHQNTAPTSSASAMMDYNAPPLQQSQMSLSTSSAPGYLETHMHANPHTHQAPLSAVQPFEQQVLLQPGSSHSQIVQPQSSSQASVNASNAMQAPIYPSTSAPGQQQMPVGNIFATPVRKQQEPPPLNMSEGPPYPKHAEATTAHPAFPQPLFQVQSPSSTQARPSSSRFGIHSFRSAGANSARPSTSFAEQQHEIQSSSSTGGLFGVQQQQYHQTANSIFKEPAMSAQTPSVSATLRAAMQSPSRLSMRSLQSFPDLSITTTSNQRAPPQQMSWMHSPSVTAPAVAPGHRYSGYDPPQNLSMSGMSIDDSYIHDSGGSWLHSGPGKSIESPTGIVRMNSPPPHLLRHSASTFSLPAHRQGTFGRSVLGQPASRPSGISQTFARARSPSHPSSSSDESTGIAVPRDGRSGRMRPPLFDPYAAYASAPPSAGLGQPVSSAEVSASTSYFSASATTTSAPPTARSDSFLVPQTASSSSSRSSGLAKSARASRRAQLLAGNRQDREGSNASSTGATTSSERASSVAARATGLVYNGTGKARYTPLSYKETSVSRSYPHEAYGQAVRSNNQAPLPAPSHSRSYVPGTPVTLAPLRRDSIQHTSPGDTREMEQTRLPSLADNLEAASNSTSARQPYADYVTSQLEDSSVLQPQYHISDSAQDSSRGQPYQSAQQ